MLIGLMTVTAGEPVPWHEPRCARRIALRFPAAPDGPVAAGVVLTGQEL